MSAEIGRSRFCSCRAPGTRRSSPVTRALRASVLGWLLIGMSAQAEGERVLEYSWLTDGRITGHQTATYAQDGKVSLHFEYADRGRGPNFDSLLQLKPDGIPVGFTASGHNNTRASIDEKFSVVDGVASWYSSVEKGTQPVEGNEFYLPFNESPEILAMLARALLGTAESRIPLLPDGEASLEKVTNTVVTREAVPQSLVLYRISGVGLEPKYLWLDEHNALFGFTDGVFAIVRKGWEPALSDLKPFESEAHEKFYEQLSNELTETLPDLTVVRGARIFDSLAGELTAPATVFIWNGSISAIYFNEIDVPEVARVIDGKGKTLMPGLWDMHNHVSPGYLLNYLASGVVNVRDMGSNHEKVQRLIALIQGGRFAGPDIHPMGFIDRQGEFAAPVGKLADSVEDAIAFVDFYAQRGYRGIKLYSSIEPEWVESLTRAAKERSLPVAGHMPAFMSPEQAIRSGFNEITHVNLLLLQFLGADTLDTRGPERFLVPGEQAAHLDLDSKEVNGFIALMKEQNIAHDSTLAPIMEMFRNRPGETSPIFSDIVSQLPGFARRKLIMTEGYNQGREQAFEKSSHTVLAVIAKLHESGVVLLPGTDNLLPGFTLIRELIYYTEAGIPANEVLQLATIAPARHMQLDHRLGSVTVGKDAQMYLVDGNPVEDIRVLYRVGHVFKGRKAFYAPDLLRAQGFEPFVD